MVAPQQWSLMSSKERLLKDRSFGAIIERSFGAESVFFFDRSFGTSHHSPSSFACSNIYIGNGTKLVCFTKWEVFFLKDSCETVHLS